METGCEPIAFDTYEMSCQTEDNGDTYEEPPPPAPLPSCPLPEPTYDPLPDYLRETCPFPDAGKKPKVFGAPTENYYHESETDEEDEEQETDDDDDDPLDDEEDWGLELIENAYSHMKSGKVGQLAQYEMRVGLDEVREAYHTLTKELGEPRADLPQEEWESKPTFLALSDYKPLVYGVLALRQAREKEVHSLCSDCAPFLANPTSPLDSPLLQDVIAAAEYTPKQRKKKGKGSPALLPRSLNVVSVHIKCVETLRTLLQRLKTESQKETVQTQRTAENIAESSSGEEEEEETQLTVHHDPFASGEPAFVLNTPTELFDMWDAHLEPVIKRLGLGRTQWTGRMREVLGNGCADASDEMSIKMAANVLVSARAGLLEAEELHESLTKVLKSVAQEDATLDCLIQLKRPRRGAPKTATHMNESKQLSDMRAKVHGLAALGCMKLKDFTQKTAGIPYVLPSILSQLVGLPSANDELLAYLVDLRDKHKPRVVLSDASASL